MPSQHSKPWKTTLLLLLGLLVFLYLFANTVAESYVAFTNPLAGLHFHYEDADDLIVVYGVVPESPAARAGLTEQDEIIAVNGTPVSSLNAFVHTLTKLEVGESILIQIKRAGSLLDLAFVSERWVNAHLIFTSLLPALFFGYSLCLIGTYVFLKKIHDRESRIFYLMCIFWALAMRDAFPQGFLLHNLLPAWLRDSFELPAWPLAIGLFLHFHLLFPVENAFFSRRSRLVLIAIYSPLILLIPDTYAAIHDLGWTPRFLQIGWGIWLSLYFMLGLLALAHSMRTAPNPTIKKQTEIVLQGTIVSLGLPLSLYFLPKLLFTKSLPYFELSGVLVVLWPFTLAYSIVKHRFMNIDVIVKRGVAYALISGFVIAAYFLLVVGVGKLVLFATGSSNQLVTIFATLLIAALFNPIKNRIQNFVERRFYPSRFTYKEAVQAFGHQLVNVLDLDKLLAMLLSFLSETMKIYPVAIYWRDAKGRFGLRKSDGLEPESAREFSGEEHVLTKLGQKRHLVDLSPLKEEPDLIPQQELLQWQKLRAEMVLPLLSKNRLSGFLTLGPKAGEEPYFKGDLDLLQSLSDRINLSLDNALLTEELREQDRLKRELEVARRIQLSSLPTADPQVPGLDISGISIPAQEVGGDYYDYIDFADGRFGVVLGDVSGKGTSAALYMSQLKGILNTASKYQQSLKDLLAEVNAVTFKNIEPQHFITLTCGAFDLRAKKFSLVRAGHLPLIYYSHRRKTFQELMPKGLGVGLENGKLFSSLLEESILDFETGDLFLFFSDGIVEARNPAGLELESNFLVDLVLGNGWDSAVSLREKIISKVHDFSGSSPQRDDMTLVVVRVL